MDRKIVAATIIIAASGIVNAWINSKPITPVILGSYIFILVLSILEMFGGDVAKLADALAMLAATYVVITEVPWNTIIGTLQGKASSPGGNNSTPQTGGPNAPGNPGRGQA